MGKYKELAREIALVWRFRGLPNGKGYFGNCFVGFRLESLLLFFLFCLLFGLILPKVMRKGVEGMEGMRVSGLS